jgi:hypothetical protein
MARIEPLIVMLEVWSLCTGAIVNAGPQTRAACVRCAATAAWTALPGSFTAKCGVCPVRKVPAAPKISSEEREASRRMAPRLPRDKSRSGKESVKGSSRRTRAANEQRGLPRIEHLKRLMLRAIVGALHSVFRHIGPSECQCGTWDRHRRTPPSAHSLI